MMADEMNRYLTPAVKKQIQAQHMSIHDFVTLASMLNVNLYLMQIVQQLQGYLKNG